MNKRPNITEQTKENIKQAFWKLYAQKPIQSIAVREITELAGYNRSTFYTYFKDVYDVLEQTERELLDMVETVGGDGEINFIDKNEISRVLKPFADFSEEKRKCIMLLMGSQGDPKFISELHSLMRKKIIQTLGSKLNPNGKYFDYIIDYIMVTRVVIIMRWFEDKSNLTMDEIVDLLYDTTIRSVVPLFDKY